LASGVAAATKVPPATFDEYFGGGPTTPGSWWVADHPNGWSAIYGFSFYFFKNFILFFIFIFFKCGVFLVILIEFQLKYMSSYQTKEYE
jgi:hypothetical protein